MKIKTILLTMLLVATQSLRAQTFHIDANLSVDDDTLFVTNQNTFKRDTVVNSNGKFSLDVKLAAPCTLNISRKPYAMSGDAAIQFIAMPGEKVSVEGNFAYYQLSGSRFYDEYDRMRLAMLPFDAKNISNIDWSTSLRNNGIDNDSVHVVFNQQRSMISDSRQSAAEQYMLMHPDEECSALLLEEIRDVHKARKCYDALSESVRTGRMAAVMAKYLKHVDKEIERLEVAKNIQPGKPAPLFALKDIKGKTLRLEKLRGKWVVVDFWGSWCFWCIGGVPQMREYYNKYKGKFEILSIDCYDKEEAWRASVEKNNMPWLHVTDPTPSGAPEAEKKQSVTYRYAIKGFPTKILVRPDGIIDKVFVGEKEEFYHYLDEKFGRGE